MNNFTYISLNCLYFLFCVFLVNTIKKEFYKQTDDKILNINSEEIFVPADRNNLDFYVERLKKFKIKPKYIFILPKSQILVNQNLLWDFFRNKFYHNINYLNTYFLKTYILGNYQDRHFLEHKIYKKNQKYPITFILSNSEKKKIFTLKNHYDFYDLISIYKEDSFNLIREISNNIFTHNGSLLMMETYILINKKDTNFDMFVYKYQQFLLYNLEDNDIIRNKNIEVLFLTPVFKKQYITIVSEIKIKLKFLYKNIKEYFFKDKMFSKSSLFELFSIRFIIDKNFNLLIFDISRKINIIDKDIIPIYSRLIVETYNLVRGDVGLEETRFFKISE